jgi:protein-S-isoprenylcysteine O-methyltransferase Ste14
MAKEPDTAGVIAFPPLIYGITLASSIMADRLLRARRLPPLFARLSIPFFGAAAFLIVASFGQFKRAGTAVDPFEETTALVQHGPFQYTRNPIYLGLTAAYIGSALAARSTLPFALLPAVLWLMNAGVIEREERYLERKFGEAYANYKKRVPRWF